jgi:hypothetical protein
MPEAADFIQISAFGEGRSPPSPVLTAGPVIAGGKRFCGKNQLRWSGPCGLRVAAQERPPRERILKTVDLPEIPT